MRLIAVSLIVTFGVTDASAQGTAECPAGTPIVKFDHLAKADVLSASVRRRDGEQFIIRVVNTRPDEFTYTVTGAVAVPQDPITELAGRIPASTHDECVTHDKGFGGYIMRVEPNAGKQSDLTSKLLIVYVPTEDWQVEFAGAFTVAWFETPLYSLTPVSDGIFRVDRDEGTPDEPKTDPLRLGVSAFVTTYHEAFQDLGFTFGLGVNEGKQATYYFGGTWRLGKKAGLTGGLAIGTVDRLPTGTQTGDTTTNANLLKELPKRTATALFVAISYSFLGSGDQFKAPLAGQ